MQVYSSLTNEGSYASTVHCDGTVVGTESRSQISSKCFPAETGTDLTELSHTGETLDELILTRRFNTEKVAHLLR